MDIEIAPRDLQDDVVFCGLDVPSSGVEHLPRGQRLKDDVGRAYDLVQADARHEPVIVLVDRFAEAAWRRLTEDAYSRRHVNTLIKVNRAVVPRVIRGNHERGNPKYVRLLQLSLGRPGARLGRGDDQGPAIGQPQGGRQIDGKAAVARLQWRQRQLYGFTARRRG